MRIFYAITFTNETLKDIEASRNHIFKNALEGKPVPTNNFHITLEYIGDIESKDLHRYKKVLKRITIKPLYLKAVKYGSFSKKGKQVVWLGIKNSNKLKQFLLQLQNDLSTLNYQKSKASSYIPHITLGRKVKLKENLSQINFTSFKLNIKSIELLESITVENKTIYKTIHTRLV